MYCIFVLCICLYWQIESVQHGKARSTWRMRRRRRKRSWVRRKMMKMRRRGRTTRRSRAWKWRRAGGMRHQSAIPLSPPSSLPPLSPFPPLLSPQLPPPSLSAPPLLLLGPVLLLTPLSVPRTFLWQQVERKSYYGQGTPATSPLLSGGARGAQSVFNLLLFFREADRVILTMCQQEGANQNTFEAISTLLGNKTPSEVIGCSVSCCNCLSVKGHISFYLMQ